MGVMGTGGLVDGGLEGTAAGSLQGRCGGRLAMEWVRQGLVRLCKSVDRLCILVLETMQSPIGASRGIAQVMMPTLDGSRNVGLQLSKSCQKYCRCG